MTDMRLAALRPFAVAITVVNLLGHAVFGFEASWAQLVVMLPARVICTGSFLNARFTRRVPMILGWVFGFVLQALLRNRLFGAALVPALAPMTGMAFMLFTFYMVPDPGTTPERPRAGGARGVGRAPLRHARVGAHPRRLPPRDRRAPQPARA